jgi:hypothetical protein
VKGHPGFLLAVYQYPVQRGATPVLGKKRTMKVQASCRRDIENGLKKKVAVIEGEEDIRRQFPDLLDPERVIDIVGSVDRDIPRCSQDGHGIKPEILLCVIAVGEHRGNVESVTEKGFHAHAPDVVIGQNHRFHWSLLPYEKVLLILPT